MTETNLNPTFKFLAKLFSILSVILVVLPMVLFTPEGVKNKEVDAVTSASPQPFSHEAKAIAFHEFWSSMLLLFGLGGIFSFTRLKDSIKKIVLVIYVVGILIMSAGLIPMYKPIALTGANIWTVCVIFMSWANIFKL